MVMLLFPVQVHNVLHNAFPLMNQFILIRPQSLSLMILALFAVAPVVCSCLLSLCYTLYLFMAYEESGVHHAQEFENRFWTIFAMLFSTALFFAQDSPLAFGRYSPSMGFFGIVVSSYAMHLWDRYMHRQAISQQANLRRSFSLTGRINDLGGTVEEMLQRIDECLRDIDQLLIPSTINNFLNQRFVLRKEKEIISIFVDCDAVTLNHLVSHVKLGLLIYKIKDHRNFTGQHRTELIQLLAVERLPALTVMSRVIVLHALQMLKLRANPRAECWVRNIILNTHGDDLSEIKTLTDSKGDYFCMNKLIFDDIKSETVRQDILNHIRKEAALQSAHMQMQTKRAQKRQHMAWRKVLSDVDDTLFSSGGHFPAGIDKRYPRKVVYPGVLAFYRELDLGTRGPEEWPEHRVGNLVFLSARPHLYKDMSEKSNFAKFEKLRQVSGGGRKGMHTVPSLLAGDIVSGSQFIATNDCEPLSKKKFDNFKRYVSIYPEYQHVFVCDNGQGDVRAGEMMFDSFPYEFEALYVHIVQDVPKTFGYAPERWREKEFSPCFFRTYPEAALHAATRDPPLIRITGLQRVCHDAVKDFQDIPPKQWTSLVQKADRRAELNQSIWRANQFLESHGVETVELVEAERLWQNGQKVRTPYGRGTVRGFDPEHDLYDVELDWRPLDVQVNEHLLYVKQEASKPKAPGAIERRASAPLETVLETDEVTEDETEQSGKPPVIERTESMPTSALASTMERKADLDITTSEGSAKPTSLAIVEESIEDSSQAGQQFLAELAFEYFPESPSGVQPRALVEFDDTQSTLSIPDKSVSSDISSVSSASDSNPQDCKKPRKPKPPTPIKVNAKIAGKFLTKYTPPVLPNVDKKNSPLFSFWTGIPKEIKFSEGDKCTTPFGPATVVEHRKEDKIVVVDFLGWKGRGYLQADRVVHVPKSIFSSLFRRQTSGGSEAAPSPKALDFPYVKGTKINTPYGNAIISRPLPMPATSKESPSKKKIASPNAMLCLSLVDWHLANASQPSLYCTVATARLWKETRGDEKKAQSDGILSAFGTLVTSTFDFAGRFSSTQKTPKEKKSSPKLVQFYRDGAAVSTSYGPGSVLRFRDNDGFYEVSLIRWTLANGSHPIAYLRELDISYRIAKGCQEGYPVLTTLGLTGNLQSVEPSTGVHLVTVPSCGLAMYLQPESIVRPLKAAKGDDVLTAYGEGKVIKYDIENNTYQIKLRGWEATLYAKAETFDRVWDSLRDRGPSGMDWIYQFFFSGPGTKDGETRSRSNSIVSATRSVKSQNV
jgi:hypothetical protein